MTAYQSKKQNRKNNIREKRKIILIGCEGNNKTEKAYFSSFNNIQREYVVKFSCGNNTDLNHILASIKKEQKRIGYDSLNDKLFAVFDIDNDINKMKNFENLKELKEYSNITFIPSNPCFELWYLLHFIYTTKSFNTSEELFVELDKYIHSYDKSKNYFDYLFPIIEKAIKNNEKLSKYITSQNNKGYLRNSYTEVMEIVKILYSSIKN